MLLPDKSNQCPSFYQGVFKDPDRAERWIFFIYSCIFFIGLLGNVMTIIIMKSNLHLRTPTNTYLLNLAVSDLMILLCNLPIEILEIYHRQWPLSVIFCKLRNIFAEFFTCSSILTIVAFTCERYFTIVHPVHLHRLSHFRRAHNIIAIIWCISLSFSLFVGLSYEIRQETISSVPECKACVSKKSFETILSIIIIVTSIGFFYLPMLIIGAIYLFIGQALRRLSQYEIYSHQLEPSISSQSSENQLDPSMFVSLMFNIILGLSNREAFEMQRRSTHFQSYTWLKMRARYQARQVVVRTLST